MKLLVLAALIAAVVSVNIGDDSHPEGQSPWQVGKVYHYDVSSHTLARLTEGPSSGSAFKARFVIRVKAPGQLQAKLEQPQHAQVHQELPDDKQEHLLPSELQYQPVQNLEKPFEIKVDGGRVLSLTLPSSLPLSHENLLKGLIGALQVDLSTHHNVHSSKDYYDRETHQGLFRKMETDVTGDCETLYSVSPVASEWRRELPHFAAEEDPIEITKSKNYGHCHHRVAYHFGVPHGAEWTGTAHHNNEEQFIRRATVSRILASKQGQIYKSEITSTVHVHPYLYGKQKAQVHSRIVLKLTAVQPDQEQEWQLPEDKRVVQTLLYAISHKQIAIHDKSSASSSSESHEHMHIVPDQPKLRAQRSVHRHQPGKHSHEHSGSSSSSSSHSSSSKDSSSAYKNDEIPNNNEPAYAALYMSHQSHAEKKQNPMNAQKLLQDIAQQLQNPNNMPKADFLTKFNILVRVIAGMSSEQLTQTSRSIEVGKSSNNNVKANMWMIYRDAVVQAGTLPAFQQIKSWILSKKIQGEEAAQVVATLANTLRYPTKDVMIQFFKLARSPEVKEQEELHNTALFAASKLINLGHVNNDTAHSFYPTHMYGRLSHKHDNFVLEEILPALAADLKEAIQQENSRKAQVYIKAIGNLGHREILKVFAPYLEGQIKTSTYLRGKMVADLYVLAHQKDKYARAVLYSILRNTAEPYEVRVTAIQNIFMAHPTAAMLQAMAQMTHDDPSIQVRAVLKSAIKSAAELNSPRYSDIAQSAKAVKWMLTKEEFGYQQSAKHLVDGYEREDDLGIFGALSYIGSEDSLLPKHWKATLKTNHGGWDKRQTIAASFSSVKEFLDTFKETLFAPHSKSDKTHKYSADKISEMLNIKREHKKPLEASFYVDLMNQERYYTFGEQDIKQLPQAIKEYMEKVKKGVDQHYTKVINQGQVSIMFPISSGMPFIYKYKEPTLVHIQGKLQGDVNFPSQEKRDFLADLNKEVQFTYARNIDGSVGFIDTLADQYPQVGIVTKFQVHLPIKLEMHVKPKEVKVKVEPLHPEQDSTIIHYSIWPYVANQKKDSLVAISQDPTTKVIERPKKSVSIDSKFGQATGTIFHFQGYSYSADYKDISQTFHHHNLFSNIAAAFNQKDVAMTHYNLRYLGKQSQNKGVTLTAVYDEYYNQKQTGEVGPASNQRDMTPNSQSRREELAKRVAAGINTARSQVVDLSASFEGPHKAEFVLTAAYGESPVDKKAQYAFFAGRDSAQGQSQVNGVGHVQKPEINYLNYLQALNKDLKTKFETEIKYGQNGQIHIQGQLDRTQKYVEELKKQPYAKKCTEQIAQGNHYQPACQKALTMANAPDHMKVSVTYKELSAPYRTAAFQVYKMLEYMKFWNTEINPLKTTPEGKLELEVEASYIENSLQATMDSKYGNVHMRNIQIPEWAADALTIDVETYKPHERVANYYFHDQYQPHCTVDSKRIRTFSNRKYDYELSSSWHVVMQDQAQERGNWHEIAILARKPSQDKQDVYISYKSETGQDLEVEIQPAPEGQKHQVVVRTNSKKISEGDLTTYWDEVEEAPLLEYFTHKDGVLVIKIQEDRLRALYDGKRLVVLADNHRKSARGICGRMTGDPRDDYLTPEGLVNRPEHYAASYALSDENSDPKTQQLKSEAKKQAYKPEHFYTSFLRSDQQWTEAMKVQDQEYGSEIIYRSRSYNKQRGPCAVQQQVQYYENHGEICVSTSPLPACQPHCRGQEYKVQPVQVTCGSKVDEQFQNYKHQIQQGQNPTVSGVPHIKQYKVPANCVA